MVLLLQITKQILAKMNLVQYTILIFSILLMIKNAVNAGKWGENYDRKVEATRTVIVDKSGAGNFRKVQDAINSVPSYNKEWIKIHMKAGVYTEKVKIRDDQPFIVLEGEDDTVIQYGDYGNSSLSATFIVQASNFVAINIIFLNTYHHMLASPASGSPRVTWAPAILIDGDKSAFYQCGFLGIQDTLADMTGRHYFKSCYIEGAIDFIWGYGRSIYEKCIINTTTATLPPEYRDSYITAHGRDTMNDPSGFIFKFCEIVATGTRPTTYLGRAWREYARVIYYNNYMSNIIVPEGWSDWDQQGPAGRIQFVEVGNYGPGSDTSKRVKWAARLSPESLRWFTDINYINSDNWLQQLPSELYNKIIA